MRHRIIQHAGRRYSVKLSDIVWDNLESLAGEAGLRLNQLVARVAEQAGEGANITAALRQHCLQAALVRIKELERQVEDRRLASEGVPVTLIAEACPAPCLIVSGDHILLRANTAAREWMGSAEDALIGKSVQHYFQIKSNVPLDNIVQRYAAGELGVFPARIVYVRPGRLVVARANICPAHRSGPEDLAYLILVETSRAA